MFKDHLNRLYFYSFLFLNFMCKHCTNITVVKLLLVIIGRSSANCNLYHSLNSNHLSVVWQYELCLSVWS